MDEKELTEAPEYVKRVAKYLEDKLPKDCAYLFVCQTEKEDSPNLVTSVEDERALAKELRKIARLFEGYDA